MPTFTHAAGLFLASWPEYFLELQIDRLHEKSGTFEVSGEIDVRSTMPGKEGRLITPSRINLSAPRTRQQFANLLAEREPDPRVNWPQLIDIAATKCIELFREGEPGRVVKNIKPREALHYRTRPLIIEGQSNILFGLGGISKSYIAQLCAVLIDTYQEKQLFESEPGKVGYLDYEADAEDFKDRIDRIHKGLGLEQDASEIVYRACVQPLANEVTTLRRFTVEHKIDVLVIDSGALACGGAPEDAQATLRFFGALRELGKTSLTICHQAKNLTGAMEKTVFGSAFWQNVARNVWYAKKDQETGVNQILVGLYHTKANQTKLHSPFAVKVTHESEATYFERGNLLDSPELAKGAPLHERIAIELKAGSLTDKEIAEKLEKPESTIRVTLYRHSKLFIKLSAGKWGLLQKV